MGVSVNGLNPKHINIYGNHKTELPVVNSDERPDDLLKNAIYIEGEGDQSFNDNDYILFYATGPMVETSLIGEGFNYALNSYDSLSYYYLSIDASEPAKRLTTMTDAAGAATHNTSSFNEVAFYEKDVSNLLMSGDIWVGEEFDITPEQSFTLPTPDVVSATQATLKAAIVANAPSGVRKFNVTVNNQFLGEIDGLPIYGAYAKGVSNFDEFTFGLSGASATVKLEFEKTNPASIGWLNYLQLNYRTLHY